MNKYTKMQVYEEILRIGEIKLFKILFGERYKKLNKRGILSLWYREWGQRTPYKSSSEITREDINGPYDCIVVRYNPYNKYNYEMNDKSYYSDHSRYPWSGKEIKLIYLARDIMPYTYKEQIELLGRPFESNPNVEKGVMAFYFSGIGSIKKGKAFYSLNNQPKIEIELNTIHYDFKSEIFNILIRTECEIKSLVFTVEKDGLILDKYDFLVSQAYEKLGWHDKSMYLNMTQKEPANYQWYPKYSLPLYSDRNTWTNTFMNLSVEILEKINPMIEYAKVNPNNISLEELKDLKRAKSIINKYAGYKAEPEEK